MKLSGVVITKNEAENIKYCLDSLKFCDEVVVVDDYSTDKTIDIAKMTGARIFLRKLNDDFSAQKNFGKDKALGSWVLFVDADEIVTNKLASEIKTAVADDPTINGYYLRRRDNFLGKWLNHGETGNIRLLRLARKDKCRFDRRVHEVLKVEGKSENLRNELSHYPHKNLSEFIHKIDYFSTLHAKANLDEGKRSSVVKIIIWPLFKFIKNYIIRMGILDGTSGFVHAMMMSLHSYLSWSNLWLRQKKI